MIAFALTAAHAADIHVALSIDGGAPENWVVPSSEGGTKKIGPTQVGKTTSVYTVTVQPSVWDPLVNAFRVDLAICRDWTKKGEPGRYCNKEASLAPSEADGPKEITTALAIAGEKYAYVARTWYTGDPPVPPTPPAEGATSDESRDTP